MGSVLQDVLPSLFSQKDAMYTTLALNWSSIVGEEIAQKTLPLRFVSMKQKEGGILYVALLSVDAFFSLSKSQEIMERVNQYMGYRSVSHVTFRQHTHYAGRRVHEHAGGTPPSTKPSQVAPQSTAPSSLIPTKLLEDIPSGTLHDALHALALSIYEE